MINIVYTNGEPVKTGDIVHVRNRAYIVAKAVGDHVALYSMDERKEYRHVFPQDIGARIINEHVHPTLRACL